MPELPEVETIRRGLSSALTSGRVKAVITGDKGLRSPFPEKLQEKLSGSTLEGVDRRAKYLLFRFANGRLMVIHLGMSGRVRVDSLTETERHKHDHLVVAFEGGTRLVLNDPRRFGTVLVFESDEERAGHPAFCALGPEPLEDDFSGRKLAARLKGRKQAIKQALLDQRVVAGIGNIYASEALFAARISPFREAGALGEDDAERLVVAIRTVLCAAIAAGGSSLKDYRQADGSMGYFQHAFSVYDRRGQSCPACRRDGHRACAIVKTVQGGRATYYCERTQI